MRTNFENLRVYQLSEEIADVIWETARGWNAFARNTVGTQIVRAADSVGANIAEGAGRGTYPDNRRFVRNARGSLNETKHWLSGAYRRGLLRKQTVAQLEPLLDELGPKLNNYLKSIGQTAGLAPQEESDN